MNDKPFEIHVKRPTSSRYADDSNDDETSHILGDESQIRTPNDSPEQTR